MTPPRSPSSSSSSSSSPASLLGTSPSISSTFSDISVLSLPAGPSPCVSPVPPAPTQPSTKTSAFFGSPFNTRPPSPDLPPRQYKPSSNHPAPNNPDPPPLVPRLIQRLFPSRHRSETPIDAAYDLHKQALLDRDRSHDTPSPLAAPFPDPASTPRPPSPVPSPSSPSSVSSIPTSPFIPALHPPESHDPDEPGLIAGDVISSRVSGTDATSGDYRPYVSVILLRALGQGAFSNVWLAEDASDPPLSLGAARVGTHPRGGHISGISPFLDAGRPVGDASSLDVKYRKDRSRLEQNDCGRLVAVKVTPRARLHDTEQDRDRTRVGFIREVEVLRHISHPNITTLLGALTTQTHHVLVLPHLAGGDLLTLVNNDSSWGALTESTVRRLWYELCSAVGWMHSIGLVHRDIKLENILLVVPVTPPPPFPQVLTQLGDFGLARFIDPRAPYLGTRCGSEAYAAPELVTAGERYDPRATDAWACGVVLYGLCVRKLPFGDGPERYPGAGAADGDGGGAGEVIRGDHLSGRWGSGGVEREEGRGRLQRRKWLMRIARGQYEWPQPSPIPGGSGRSVDSGSGEEEEEEIRGAGLVRSGGARRIVGRLLVRDPARRAAIGDLWGDEWMLGEKGVGGKVVDWKRVDKVVCRDVV